MNKKCITFILLAVMMLAAVTGLNVRQATANQVAYGVKDVTGLVQTDVLQFADEYLSGISADIAVYDPEEMVDVIIELGSENDSLLALSKKASAESIAAYIASKSGEDSIKTIEEKQDAFKSAVDKLGINITYKYSYSAVVNGLAARVKYGDIEKLQAVKGVSNVTISELYSVPDTKSSATQMNISVARDETGYTGSGMTIAIIDTGVEYTHEAFSVDPEEQKFSKDYIAEIIESTAAYNCFSLFVFDTEYTDEYSGKQLTADDVYKSGKIPFYFDYTQATGDNLPSQDHGTHVAGIAAGNNGGSFTGAAYDAQVLAFNVFGEQSGASTVDILAALNDAVLMGVDAINLSLGTTSGYKFTEYPDKFYKMAEDAGIMVSVSSGNSYWAGYYGENGNYPSIENMDYGVVGTPGSFDNVFTVGSYNAYEFDEAWFYVNGEQVNYMDVTGHKFDEDIREGLEADEAFEEELVYIPIIVFSPPYMMTRLARDNWSNIDVKGKVAVITIDLGLTIVEPVGTRIGNAFKYGATAVIFALSNSDEYTIILADDYELPLPVCVVGQDYYDLLRESSRDNDLVKVYQGDRIHYPLAVSDFSSRGATQDLKLKPDILATGSPIYSSVLNNYYGYMSGTSMAAPNITGITTIVKQYVNETFPEMSATEKAATVMRLIMSTATIIKDENGVSVSPRTQGAGLANVLNAVTAQAYIAVDGTDKSKLELGDDPEKTGVYTLKFKVVNISDHSKAYAIDVDTITEGYLGNYLTPNAYQLTPFITYRSVGGGAVTENGTLFVEANGTAEVTVTLTLSDEDVEYMKAFPNGVFVEGFVKLISDAEDGMDLNVPFMGYYGDWYELPLLDNTMYDGNNEIVVSGVLYGKNGKILGREPYTVAEGLEQPAADKDKIYINTIGGGNKGLNTYYLGALRNLYSVNYKISDYDTGELYLDSTYLWVAKSASGRTGYVNTMGYPYSLDWDNLSNFGEFKSGERFLFTVEATLIDDEGKEHKETIEYTVKVDNTKPEIIQDSAKLVFENGRLYFTADFYDNECLMLVYMQNPNVSTGVYPFDSQKGEIANFKVDVTDYYSQLKEDGTITVFVEDYAHNRSTFEITLPVPDIKTAVPKELNVTNSHEDRTLAINEYKDINFEILPIDPFYNIITKEYIVGDESIVRAKEDGMLGLATGNTDITIIVKIEMNNGSIVTLSDTFSVEVTEETVRKTNADSFYLTFDDPLYKDIIIGNEHGMHVGFTVTGGGNELDFNVNPVPWYADDTVTTALSFSSIGGDGADYGVGTVFETIKVEGTHIYLIGYNARVSINVVIKGGYSILFYVELRKPLKANPDEEEFVIQEKSNGQVYLTRYNGTSSVVEIPEGVTVIGDYTFATRTNIRKVILPESLIQISNYAFADSSIEEIVVNKQLAFIQSYAFLSTPLKSITFPEGSMLNSIANNAFYNCKLEYADFSNVISEEGLFFNWWSFYNCTELKEVKFPTDALYAFSFYAFKNCSSLKEVVLNDKCQGLSVGTFQYCTSLERVVLPSNTEIIAQELFLGCSSLNTINIPESVTEIYMNAFDGTALTELTIRKNIKVIATEAFANCKYLKKLTIEEGFEEFVGYGSYYGPTYLFSNCTALEEVILPESLTNIPEGLFSGCTSLRSVNIPSNITTIGEYAFYNTALSEISLPEALTSIGHYSFANTLLENVKFNEQLSVIGDYAFANTYLKEINIPESLTYIGNYAFAGVALDMAELRFGEEFIFLGAYSFCDAQIQDIYLPAGLEIIDFSANLGATYHITEGCELVKVIGNSVYANDGNVMMFYQGVSIDVEIADGTVRIHQGAFANVDYIETLVLPASLKRIGEGVFNFTIGSVRFLGDAPILEGDKVINTFLPGTTIYVNANAKGFDTADWESYNIVYLTEGLLLNEKINSRLSDAKVLELYAEYKALSSEEKEKVTKADELISRYIDILSTRNDKALEEVQKALEEARKQQEMLEKELEAAKKENEELQKKYDEVTNLPSCGGQSEITFISIISFIMLAAAVVFLTLRRRNSIKK